MPPPLLPLHYRYNPHHIDRELHWVVWQRLLGSGVQTANGDEADWCVRCLPRRASSAAMRKSNHLITCSDMYVHAHIT